MKYYTIIYPGEFGQHIQETFSEEQILKSYWEYWKGRMQSVNRHELINENNCIEDWKVEHWAEETDEFGNKL